MNKKLLMVLKIVAAGVGIGATLLSNFVSDKEQKQMIIDEVAKVIAEKK